MQSKPRMDFLVGASTFVVDRIVRLSSTGIPVTENGKINSKLLGLITFRDIDFLNKDQWATTPVSQFMTPVADLITARNDLTLRDAYLILQRSKKGSFDFLFFN